MTFFCGMQTGGLKALARGLDLLSFLSSFFFFLQQGGFYLTCVAFSQGWNILYTQHVANIMSFW